MKSHFLLRNDRTSPSFTFFGTTQRTSRRRLLVSRLGDRPAAESSESEDDGGVAAKPSRCAKCGYLTLGFILSILPCSDIPKSSNHKEIPILFVDDLPIPIPYPHDSWVSSRRLMGMLFCRNCGQRRSGTGLDAMDFASAFGGIKDAVREEQQRHLDGHVSYIHQVYPMDPWRLRRYGELPSHHAPVILPKKVRLDP